MARKGPKRKLVERYPSGQPKKPTLAERAARERQAQEIEMQVVLRQPHRMGDRHQWRASALGRFVLAHRLRAEFYDAGSSYNAKVRRLWAAKGVPTDVRLGGASSDEGPPAASVRRWEAELASLNDGLKAASAYGAVRALAVFDHDLHPHMKRDLIAGLHALAVGLGLMRAGEHPFA